MKDELAALQRSKEAACERAGAAERQLRELSSEAKELRRQLAATQAAESAEAAVLRQQVVDAKEVSRVRG